MEIKIGVVAICYNESRDIEGFINNLCDWVHEIIIVDDGSTDNTKELLMQMNNPLVKFIVSPRKSGEYFADQRNKGINVASSDWLLHMDIDERVSSGLKFEIIEAISKTEYNAYKFGRINYFLNRPMKGGGWADWNQIHLAQREVLKFSGLYHEKIELNSNAKVGQLQYKMIHLNDDDYKERLTKSNRYLVEITNELRRTHKSMKIWRILHLGVIEILKKFIVKKGYLDGKLGLFWALHSSMAKMKAAMILWDEQNRVDRSKIEIP